MSNEEQAYTDNIKRKKELFVNAVIDSAAKSGPKILMSKDIWVVEGNPELNQLNIKDIQSIYTYNVTDWVNGKNKGWILLGVFNDYEAAGEYCNMLREYFRDIDGRVLI